MATQNITKDLKLGQAVALKFLPPKLAQDPVRRERFFAEVRITRQLSHPNICRVYDIGDIEGRHFLSMEFIDGEDLASLLKRIGHLTNEKALDIARMRAWLAGSLADTLGAVPGFAAGGRHRGGARIVGELGPELEVTGPALIYSTNQTAQLLATGSQRADDLLAQAVDLLERVHEAATATAMHSHSTAKQLRRAMPDGDALAVRTATD